jgi:hypothetical protein
MVTKLDEKKDPGENLVHMADIIDLSLIRDARRHFRKLLDDRGLSYFLKKDGHRLFQIQQSKVDLVVRNAARARATDLPRPPRPAIDHCRREIRRELIRRVVEAMLQTGL